MYPECSYANSNAWMQLVDMIKVMHVMMMKIMSFVFTQRCTEVTKLCINFVSVPTIYNHVCRNDLNRSDLNKKET